MCINYYGKLVIKGQMERPILNYTLSEEHQLTVF